MFMMSQPADRLPIQFDPEFATDIGLKMQVPERIGVISGADSRWSYGMPSSKFEDIPPMSIPEKIIALGRDQSMGIKKEPRLHLDLVSLPSSDQIVNVSTPPRVLTLEERPLLAADGLTDETDNFENGKTSSKSWNGYTAVDKFNLQFSKHNKQLETMLIRRHLSELSQQIGKLEKENLWRSRREMILYPFLLGYVLFRVVQWAVRQ